MEPVTSRGRERANRKLHNANFPHEEEVWPEVGRLPVSLCDERNSQDEQAYICKFALFFLRVFIMFFWWYFWSQPVYLPGTPTGDYKSHIFSYQANGVKPAPDQFLFRLIRFCCCYFRWFHLPHLDLVFDVNVHVVLSCLCENRRCPLSVRWLFPLAAVPRRSSRWRDAPFPAPLAGRWTTKSLRNRSSFRWKLTLLLLTGCKTTLLFSPEPDALWCRCQLLVCVFRT